MKFSYEEVDKATIETSPPETIETSTFKYEEVDRDSLDFGGHYGSKNDHKRMIENFHKKMALRLPEDDKELSLSTEHVKGLLFQKEPTYAEVAKTGFQHSVSGLMLSATHDKPLDTIDPNQLTTSKRLLNQAASLAGDLPFMVAGALIGAEGGPVTSVGGAFALPQGLRKVYLDQYEKGEIKTFKDFWNRLSGAVWETLKGETTGAAVGKVGMVIHPTLRVPAEVITMVGVSSALEGHVPQPEEFMDAAILIGGLHGARAIQKKLTNIYVEKGVRPNKVYEDMKNDVSIEEDIANPDIDIPRFYAEETPKQEGPRSEQAPKQAEEPITGLKDPGEIAVKQGGELAEVPTKDVVPIEKVQEDLNADFDIPQITLEQRPPSFPKQEKPLEPPKRPTEEKPELEAPKVEEVEKPTVQPWDYLDTTHPDAVTPSYNLSSGTMSLRGGENLTTKQLREYHKVWIDRYTNELKSVRGQEVNTYGVSWANKSQKRARSTAVKKLLAKKKAHTAELKNLKKKTEKVVEPPAETQRVEETDSTGAKVDFVLKPEPHRAIGTEAYTFWQGKSKGPTLAKAKTFIRKLSKLEPNVSKSFQDIVFEVSEAPHELLYNGKTTNYRIKPEALGIDPSTLMDRVGSRIKLDLDAWLAKPFSYTNEAPVLKGTDVKTTGDGWWSDGSMVVGGKTPDRLAVFKESGAEPDHIQRAVINKTIADAKAIKEVARKQSDGEYTYIKIGKRLYDEARIKFFSSNASEKLRFKATDDGTLLINEGKTPIGVLMPISESVAFKPTAEDAVYKFPKPKKLKKFSSIYKPEQGYKTPRGTASAGRYTESTTMMTMPDLVQIAKELNAGKYPQVVEKLNDALGMFRHTDGIGGSSKIQIRADLAKDPHQALMTMAHEIGHLVDWLPDKTLKRGNILGHIAGVKKYLKHFIEGKIGGESPLTPKEKTRLKAIAKKSLTKKGREYELEIDEEIRKELPVTPEDVLNIWNSVVDVKNPALIDYIKQLSRADKKSIVKEVLAGKVPEEVQQFASVVFEKTGRKITKTIVEEKHTPSKQEIVEEYKKLFDEEIKKRELFSREIITDELKALTQFLKPFDPTIDAKFTKYRYSPSELYADAISTLFNSPQVLKAMAPEYWRGFFSYLESRPKVYETYKTAIENIKSNRNLDVAEASLLEGFEKGEGKWAEAAERINQLKDPDFWGNEFIDQFYSTIRRVKAVGEKGLPEGTNPRYAIEDLLYSGAEREGYLSRIAGEVTRVLDKEGVEKQDFSLYLFYRRVMSESDRASLFNPEGFDPGTAGKQIAKLEKRIGKDKLEKLTDRFHKIRHEVIVAKAEAAKMHSPELIESMREYKDYATFDVVDYMNQKFGKEATSQVYRQVGTFKQVADPFAATMLKDLKMIDALNRNIAVEKTIQFLDKNLPEESIVPDRFNRFGRTDLEWPSAIEQRKDYDLLYYMKNGEIQGRYLPKNIVESFKENPYYASRIGQILRYMAAPFRAVFVTYNPGFQLYNLIRDYRRTAKNIPDANIANIAPYYAKAFGHSFKRAFGLNDATINEMLSNRMLVTVTDFTGETPIDLMNERLLKRYNLQPKTWNEKIATPITSLFETIQKVGAAVEGAPKFATNEFLKEKRPDIPVEERAHMVRVRGGSPAFLRRGRAHTITNNLFLFSNAIKEGWRGDIESIKKDPLQYMWKTAQYDMLPKFLMAGAAWGFFGEEIKERMARISQYMKANYTVIPVGITPNGKTVTVNLPTDDMGRFFGGLTWQALQYAGDKAGITEKEPVNISELARGIFDYTAGQAPGLNPGFKFVDDIVTYAGGNNPYDSFYKRHAVEDTVFQAGGTESLKQFGQSLWNKSGGGVLHRFRSDDPGAIKTEIEQIIGKPILSNTLGRFVKVTDYGLREEIREGKDKIRTAKAQDTLAVRKIVDKLLDDEPLTSEDKEVLARKGNVSLKNRTWKRIAQRYGNVFIQEFFNAQSKEEKLLVINRMEQDSRGSDVMPYLEELREALAQ